METTPESTLKHSFCTSSSSQISFPESNLSQLVLWVTQPKRFLSGIFQMVHL